MFGRFTDTARRVLVLAQEEARRLDHGFYRHRAHPARADLREHWRGRRGARVDGHVAGRCGEKVAETVGPVASPTSTSPPFTPRAKKVLELSLREALQLGHDYIGTEHMLLGLVREGEGVGARVLLDLGADLQRARQEVIQRLSAAGPVNIGKHAAVDGDLVEASDIPVGAAALLGWEDAAALLLSGPLLAATSRPLPLPRRWGVKAARPFPHGRHHGQVRCTWRLPGNTVRNVRDRHVSSAR